MGTLKKTGILLAVFASLAVSSAASASAAETGYNPNNLPTAGCFWTGPFSASNDATNNAYPGTETDKAPGRQEGAADDAGVRR